MSSKEKYKHFKTIEGYFEFIVGLRKSKKKKSKLLSEHIPGQIYC